MLAFLIFLCGFVFFVLSLTFDEGRFFVLFFILGTFVSLFLPAFFFFQGRIQRQKYTSHVYLEYLLDYSSNYDSFSFVYQTEDIKKHKGILFNGNEKELLFPQYNYKGYISNTPFFSYVYEIDKQRNRLISFTLSYFVPISFALIDKEKKFKEDSFSFLFETEDYRIYVDKNAKMDFKDMIVALNAIKKKYGCKVSLLFKNNLCQIYLYDKEENILSLKPKYSKKDEEKIKSDYLLVYDIYHILCL